MKKLVLIRHAETEWSAAGRLNGWTDIPLSDAGRSAAQVLGRELGNESFDTAWTSDLSRAAETARLALGPATSDERLRELDFGSLEGTTWDEIPGEVQEQLLAFDDFAAPGGETVAQLASRVDAFLAELPPGRHAVVTHGGVIRFLLRRAGSNETVFPGRLVELIVE